MMVKFDTKKLRAEAEKDYEGTWLESGKLIEKKGRVFSIQKKSKPHPLYNLIERTRRAFLDLGFTEIVVPMIVDKREVQLQYGPESAVILDRIFFLAGLERPDIGIGQKKISDMRKIAPDLKDIEKVQAIFRRYKKGEIASDDLVEVMVNELGLNEEQATAILSMFSEFKGLKPMPMDITLRSHTTSGWLGILRELQRREQLPIQLFSIGPKFRREQRLDESHLYESWTASMVVMAEKITLEDGESIAKEALKRLGFGDVKVARKKATSKYYAPQTEFEVFVRHPKTGGLVEVGDGGFYSPVTLSNYDIPYPTFNLGIGLERLLMIETGEADIRALVFPHLYKLAVFSDDELAKMIRLEHEPMTKEGKGIAAAIVKTSERHADAPSPCEFKAFEGKIQGRKVLVKVVEPESDTKLIGPAGFNELYVYDGNIIGLPPKGWKSDEFLEKVRESGVPTGIRLIEAFSALAASEVEKAAARGESQAKVQVKNVKLLSDINLRIDEVAQRYITSNKKRIDVRGPVFATVVADLGK